jgi:hypothetical protein
VGIVNVKIPWTIDICACVGHRDPHDARQQVQDRTEEPGVVRGPDPPGEARKAARVQAGVDDDVSTNLPSCFGEELIWDRVKAVERAPGVQKEVEAVGSGAVLQIWIVGLVWTL